jgi:hypothetical protein
MNKELTFTTSTATASIISKLAEEAGMSVDALLRLIVALRLDSA